MHKVWEEWMGYTVHYIHNGQEYVDPSTSYGATIKQATAKMSEMLLMGKCAWIKTVDPEQFGDIPF